MTLDIRPEATPVDCAAIEAVTIAAFRGATHTSQTEQFIVNALRAAGQLAVSLVAEDEGVIVGHVAVSPVVISGGVAGWYGLGPLSVVPARRRQGVGGQLVMRALAELRGLGADGCVVLGEPAYYTRFGFSQAAPTLVLSDVPPAYFLAYPFGGALPGGTVSYHSSFLATA